MADDDDVPQPLPAALPPLAVQKAVRRVPGSFDGAEISPVKEHFDAMPSGAPAASDAANPPTVVPEVLKPSKSPAPIPPVIESSFADGTGLESTENADLRAEQAVRTHLQDIESSFAAPLSPVTTTLVDGFNDTFLLDRTRPAKSAPALSSVTEEPHPEAEDTSSIEQRDPAASVGNDSLTQPALPPVSSSADVADIGNTTASLETLSSSPTAAAAARTVSRALSSLSSHGRDDSTNPTEQATKEAVTRDETPPQNLDLSGSSNTAVEAAPENLSMHSESSVRRSPSGRSLRRSTSGIGDAAHTPGHALRQGKRPKYLRSRNASQRSSTSSFLTNNDSHDDCDSDVTVGTGADYALQSGGAVPALGARRSLSNILSRSISMGSMASGIEDLQEAPGRLLDNIQPLETLDEVDTPRKPVGRLDDDLLQTPKPAANGPLAAPTDTVIARHVRNVQVPESLAKEYKSKSGLATPRRPSDYSVPGTAGRHAKSLTLKEQSSTIERLSKENFDLKLKVMFLSDRLDKLSEEGVKEMISENVELRTSLAMAQRDNKALRRRVKELEKQLKEDEHRPSTARSGDSSNDPSSSRFFDQEAAQEREEELIYLRERVEEYVVEIERLRKENMAKEAEKRKMAEVVKTLGERTGESLGRQEEADVWKDLLEQETARREQADEDNRKLQDEIFKLKQELSAANAAAAAASVGATGLHHTTNIYNITKKRGGSPSRSTSGLSGDVDGALANAVTASTTSTLVEELRRESEQLRHENAELRREVGAQTSMLTSRNREKERLYQEIEDLKMAQRRGAPAPSTVDSLLERSASRAGAHERSHSRTSGTTRNTGAVEDDDREELENKLAEQRDKINEVRLQNQELQRELDACMEDFEAAIEGKRQTEELAAALQEDLDAAMNDLVALQAERDEALREQADMEAEFEALRKEAQDEIDALENEAEQRNEEINRLQLELNDRSETFDALQEEMRKMSEALLRLEDDQDSKLRRIQQLEQELSDATRELEELETKLIEANEKANRLGVQQESSQGEIAFLREEQEADKIRIGDLEAALANAEQSLREERERTKELEQRLVTERRQREILATREKAEVQQFVNELNRENSAAKDEARRLRKNLSSREIEAAEWKERLLELENNLREALGDLHGTRSSLLKSIAKLQQDLENTVRELDTTKASLVEKDRIIKQRDALLESHSLEARKVAEALDKERQAHRNTKHQFETFQKTHQHVQRTVSTQEARIMELENGRQQDKKKIASLEATFRDQLTERNNLLLLLWTRLSSLCGTDWAHDNSLINGRALPSLEAVATMLPGFSKNLLAAVKTIETMVGGFQSRIKGVERDLWREYQLLENHLEVRTKKLERLESIVRNGVASGALGGGSDLYHKFLRLEEAYRQLKVENATLRTANDVRSRAAHVAGESAFGTGSPSPSVPTGPSTRDRLLEQPRDKERDRSARRGGSSSRTSTMTQAHYAQQQSHLPRPATSAHGSGVGTSTSPGPMLGDVPYGGEVPPDPRWMLRLRELESKLKLEREGRNMDRSAAKQRLTEQEDENRTLREENARMRRANGSPKMK